jgi:hypothetical protein
MVPEEFTIRRVREPRRCTLILAGHLDSASASTLEEMIVGLCEDGTREVLVADSIRLLPTIRGSCIRREAMKEAADMSGTPLLTQRQVRCMEKLPEGHKVLSTRYGAPIVHRPAGRLLRVQPNGRLAPTIRVERVQSYLHLHG